MSASASVSVSVSVNGGDFRFAVPLDSPQSVNPIRTLTVPGFGAAANLTSPPFTLTLTRRIPPRLVLLKTY